MTPPSPDPVRRTSVPLGPGNDRVGVRELRTQLAAAVRRVEAGDEITVTVDGLPVARLVPLGPVGAPTLDDLVSAGLVDPPGRPDRPPAPDVAVLPVDASPDRVLDEVRR